MKQFGLVIVLVVAVLAIVFAFLLQDESQIKAQERGGSKNRQEEHPAGTANARIAPTKIQDRKPVGVDDNQVQPNIVTISGTVLSSGLKLIRTKQLDYNESEIQIRLTLDKNIPLADAPCHIQIVDTNQPCSEYPGFRTVLLGGVVTNKEGVVCAGDSDLTTAEPDGIWRIVEEVPDPSNPNYRGYITVFYKDNVYSGIFTTSAGSTFQLEKLPTMLTTIRCLTHSGRPVKGMQVRVTLAGYGSYDSDPNEAIFGTTNDSGEVFFNLPYREDIMESSYVAHFGNTGLDLIISPGSYNTKYFCDAQVEPPK